MIERFQYHSETGVFEELADDGTWVQVEVGYSGCGAGRNNPALEAKAGVGPVPRGRYIIGSPHHSERVGPVAMFLTPVGHDARKRSALMIHGDNSTHTASRGCVVLTRNVRTNIATQVKAAMARNELVTLEVV